MARSALWDAQTELFSVLCRNAVVADALPGKPLKREIPTMSPLKVKRPSSDFIETPRKRQKADAANSKKKSGTSAEAAFLDQLAWKEVIIPDRFDDAEGFFGLEEIDDVDIVRDAGNGKVQYRVGKEIYPIFSCYPNS